MDESDTVPEILPSTSAIKKNRRQTAFYPNVNSTNKPQKPFSRSAAKRESVMALGSIEHLQHYFTKTGIAAKKTALSKPHHGLVPAIGGPSHIRTNPSLGQLHDFDLPPSPVVPVNSRPAFPHVVKSYQTDPESLLPGVVDDLTAVARAWELDSTAIPHDPRLLGGTPSSGFDVLDVLKTTTRAVRSIRNYVVSLPDESAGTLRAQFRSKSLAAPAKIAKQRSTSPATDPLSLIRRSALDVLTVLRELEDSARVPLTDDAYDAQSDHGSGSGSAEAHSRVASPSTISDVNEQDSLHEMHDVDPDTSVAFSLVQVHGRYESVPVWEDEDAGFELNAEELRAKRDHWDERLVLGSGWLYKQDLTLEKLKKEKAVVARYIDEVDTVLFGGAKDGIRGWERERARAAKKERADNASRASKGKGRRVSEGGEGGLRFLDPENRPQARRVASVGVLNGIQDLSLTEEPEQISEGEDSEPAIEDDDLPKWAKRSPFVDDPLGRTHAVLFDFLPVHLLPSLLAPTSRTHFLQALSSGQLLCVAYNACVRKSRKPWGYVNKDAIHDIIALEQSALDASPDDKDKNKRAWTFRRTDNLRLWAGALKLRYMLPIVSPNNKDELSSGRSTPLPSPSPSRSRFASTEPPITFDAPIVARKDEGWEDILETTLLRWVDAVVEERRSER